MAPQPGDTGAHPYWPPCCISQKLFSGTFMVPAGATLGTGLNGTGNGGWDVHALNAWDAPVAALNTYTAAASPVFRIQAKVNTTGGHKNHPIELVVSEDLGFATRSRWISSKSLTWDFAPQGRIVQFLLYNRGADNVYVDIVCYVRRGGEGDVHALLNNPGRCYPYDSGLVAMNPGDGLQTPIFTVAAERPWHQTAFPAVTTEGIEIHHVGTAANEVVCALPTPSAGSSLRLYGADKPSFSDARALLTFDLSAGGTFWLQQLLIAAAAFRAPVHPFRVPSAYWFWKLICGADPQGGDAFLTVLAGGLT